MIVDSAAAMVPVAAITEVRLTPPVMLLLAVDAVCSGSGGSNEFFVVLMVSAAQRCDVALRKLVLHLPLDGTNVVEVF